MPYINQKRRQNLNQQIDELITAIVNEADSTMDMAGLCNYSITRLVGSLLTATNTGKTSYATFALFEGVLSHVSKEIYRRLTTPYEIDKLSDNGDLEEFKE